MIDLLMRLALTLAFSAIVLLVTAALYAVWTGCGK